LKIVYQATSARNGFYTRIAKRPTVLQVFTQDEIVSAIGAGGMGEPPLRGGSEKFEGRR